MSKPKKSVYLGLEAKIAADERGGIVHRWNYGRALLAVKNGRRKLPDGLMTELIVDATRAGLKLSEREIQWRVRCATVYEDDRQLRKAITEWGTWFALTQAGFPAVEVDEEDPQDVMEEVGLASGPEIVQEPLWDIPGFKSVLKINGRKRDLADITVAEAIAYRDMCREMHANFGRTVAQVDATVEAMLAGADGDLDANALEAWKRATEGEPA